MICKFCGLETEPASRWHERGDCHEAIRTVGKREGWSEAYIQELLDKVPPRPCWAEPKGEVCIVERRHESTVRQRLILEPGVTAVQVVEALESGYATFARLGEDPAVFDHCDEDRKPKCVYLRFTDRDHPQLMQPNPDAKLATVSGTVSASGGVWKLHYGTELTLTDTLRLVKLPKQ